MQWISGVGSAAARLLMTFGVVAAASSASDAATPSISAGDSTSAILHQDGTVWSIGSTSRGVLGTATRILPLDGVLALDAGETEFVLLSDGSVWAERGHGFGERVDGTVPRQVPNLENIVQLSIASDGLALRRDGKVLAWGPNRNGTVGDGTRVLRATPFEIALEDVVAIAAGDQASYAVRRDGTVWSWGLDRVRGIEPPSLPPGAPDDAGYQLTPAPLPGIANVRTITAGGSHAAAILADGSVWTWGANPSGELGRATANPSNATPGAVPQLSDVRALSLGANFSLALLNDGTVRAWGMNDVGQLGLGDRVNRSSPTVVPGLSGVIAIAAGDRHALALANDGTVYAWGSNVLGQLGDGTIERRLTPTIVRAPTSAHARFNVSTPMERDNAPPTASARVVEIGPTRVRLDGTTSRDQGGVVAWRWFVSDGQRLDGPQVEATFDHGGEFTIVLAVTDDRGAVALDRTTHFAALPVRTIASRAQIVFGNGGSSGAVTTGGELLAWGSGFGLGLVASPFGDSDQTVPVSSGLHGVVQVVAPNGSKLALLDDGSVYAWGFDNGTGLLGLDVDDVVVNRPRRVTGLPAIEKLAATGSHVLALAEDGRIFAWGANGSGQLGVGDFAARKSPFPVPLNGRFTDIGATLESSYAIREDGTAFGWGSNRRNELGGPRTGAAVSPTPVAIAGLPAVTFAGSTTDSAFFRANAAQTWVVGHAAARLVSPQAPFDGPYRAPLLDEYVAFAGGFVSVVALHQDGTVASFGDNDASGGLGYLSDGPVDRPRRIEGLVDIVQIASTGTGAALRRDGRVFAWGTNRHGGLGDGTLAFRATPTAVLGVQGQGFLDLVPGGEGTGGANVPIPPSFRPDVIGVVKSSGPNESKSASTEIRFDEADIGRQARVFVTAFVPEGTVTPDGRLAPSANTAAPLVPVTLTPDGYKAVQGGRVQAIASMPVGDRPTRIPLFQNIPVESLGVAIFCVGYATDGGIGDKTSSQATYGNVAPGYTCPSVDSVGDATVALVEKGWWWNPSESGRGYFIETRADRIFMVGYLYDEAGRAQWVGTYTNLVADTASGPLYTLDGGQTLTGPYRAPSEPRTLGTISLRFTSPRTAVMTWPGGTLDIERAYFGAQQDAPGLAENGWWWNADEPGRGFAIELQNDAAFVGSFLYDDSGRPTWYVAQGTMSGSTRFQSSWLSFADGQTLSGPYRAPRLANPDIGSLVIDFESPRRARLLLPDGREVRLERFVF